MKSQNLVKKQASALSSLWLELMQNHISKLSKLSGFVQFCFILLVLETHMNLRVAEPDFLDNFFLPKKWTKNRFFEFNE